jgi:hypothetical protein
MGERLTRRRICEACTQATGVEAILHAGPGYFYFQLEDPYRTVSVPVYRLNHLSLEGWISEFQIALEKENYG